MAIKFEKIKPGMTLYDVRKNTGMTRNKWSVWPVFVDEVDEENRTVMASWNGNAKEKMFEGRITKFRAKKPKNENKY